jgi:hypothetical protein
MIEISKQQKKSSINDDPVIIDQSATKPSKPTAIREKSYF